MRLDGATALVTGAGSGIGRALTVELSWRGVAPILVGRTVAALEETRDQLADPSKARLLPLDLADADARQAIAAQVTAIAGGLDLLVNNAGVNNPAPLSEQDDDTWRKIFEVNLLAPMALTRNLLPLLAASDQGRVVNMGSLFGDIAFPFFAAYSASKFGLRGWTDALRRELADTGVGVTYCAPRGVRTPTTDTYRHYTRAFAMRLDEPEKVARRIADGIAADARDIYPRGPERLFLLVQKLFPKAVDGGLRRQTIAARTVTQPNMPQTLPSGETVAVEEPR